MKGFASTVILIAIVSMILTQVNLQNELQISMFEQKANIQLMQQTNEKIYNIENGFRKQVKDSFNQAKFLGLKDESLETFVCLNLYSSGFADKYKMNPTFVNKITLEKNEVLKSSLKIKSSVKALVERDLGKLVESNFDCAKFLISTEDSISIGITEELENFVWIPFDEKPVFVFEDEILNEKITVLIPEGVEI